MASGVDQFVFLVDYYLLGVDGMDYLSDFLGIVLNVIEIRLALAACKSLKMKKKEE